MSGRTITLYAEKVETQSAALRLAENHLHKIVFNDFETRNGDSIVNLKVAYRVFGKPNADKSNIVLVFHALTGDANCAGYSSGDGHAPGWWEWLFDKHGALDLRKYCVICPNHPGSCYGSSGPTDSMVGETKPIGLDFPVFSPRDLARVHKKLLDSLGIGSLALVIGGSLGGMVALEWAVMYSDFARRVSAIAAPAQAPAQSIAFNHIQRRCFEMDPNFKGGDYYGGPRPALALSLARQIAMITYRSPVEFSKRFGRNTKYNAKEDTQYYLVQSYLDYQGEKLVMRFDPNSYLNLLNALDEQDIAKNRSSLGASLDRIRCKLQLISIDSDILYTPDEIEALFESAKEHGVDTRYDRMSSLHGHDGFLIEREQLNGLIEKFIES